MWITFSKDTNSDYEHKETQNSYETYLKMQTHKDHLATKFSSFL